MSAAARAIGWEFWNRHRWPFIAMIVFIIALAAIELLFLGSMEPVRLIPPDGRGAVLVAPLSTTVLYYLAVFSFGFSGDLAARRSIFPARLFALPVTTSALVGWPMLYGALTVSLLVLAASLLARWPWGIDAPLIWPALLAASFLAWTQALMWMPYGLRGLRVIVTVLWLPALDAIVLLAMYFEISEPVMLAFLAPQLPLAYLTAHAAVARARRGEEPDWAPTLTGVRRSVDGPSRQRGHFASPERAHAWFEWRRQGRSLPALVAFVLPFELALLWLATDAPGLVFEILLVVVVTPPLLAGFGGTAVSTAGPNARDAYGVTPFVATLPMTSVGLVAAKLRMATRSTLAAWLLVLTTLPIALMWSGTWPIVTERAARLNAVVGAPRTTVFALLVVLGLVASTWKQLVQSLYIGLTGRAWIIRSSVIAVLALIVFLGPVAQWVADDKGVQGALWAALPSILTLLVVLKMLVAAGVAARLTRSGLLSDRELVTGAAIWVVIVLALYSVFAWLIAGPLFPRHILVLIAILLVPLARLSAAPLALAWNRHR